MTNESNDWELQFQALREEVQAQRKQLDKLRGVFIDPRAATYEPLIPVFKQRRAARLAARHSNTTSPPPEPRPVDPEQEKRRRQVVYWQRRVKEEERLCIELGEEGSDDLMKAKIKLAEALGNYRGLDPDENGDDYWHGPANPHRPQEKEPAQHSQSTTEARAPKKEPQQKGFTDRVWHAFKSLWD